MRILCRRTISGLQPLDEQATEELRRVPFGKPVYVEIKAARNPRQHRLLFALLKAVTDNTELFPSVEAALLAIKVGTGLVDVIPWTTPDGQQGTAVLPKSISFSNMPQQEFAPWFEQAIQLVSDRWLKVAPETLRREVEEMVS